MKGKAQIITIVSAIVLVAGIYFFGNTIPQKKAEDMPAAQGQANASDHNHDHSATWDSLHNDALRHLPDHAQSDIAALENQTKALKDSMAMVPFFEQLSDAWLAHKQPVEAGYYKYLAAKLVNSEKKLTFAGQFLLDVASLQELPGEHRHFAGDLAIESLQKAIAINPNNDSAQLALAIALIEGRGETMQGVQQLLAITRRHPDHLVANLILGKMSVQSGQFDKAVSRLETVIKQDPQNREALFFIAEAYKGQGKKEEGVNQLKKLKQMVNDSAFSADIDQYIKTF